MAGLPRQASGGGPRRSTRPPPRHRKPRRHDLRRRRRRLVQSAGLVATGCGVLAIAVGLGGWALAGQHRLGEPGPSVSRNHGGRLSGSRASVSREQTGRADGRRDVGARGGGGQPNRPVRLTIPAIGVRTRLIRLGITSHGSLQVPASAAVAGWFTGSPPPGATGAAIIAGHIDSHTGPGVFFRLRDLRRGRNVYVALASGSTVRFRVTAVRSYAKARFPTAAIYGPVPDAELRLITCGGQFDYATGSYLSNVVVYAVLVS
jgi:Sortase domain